MSLQLKSTLPCYITQTVSQNKLANYDQINSDRNTVKYKYNVHMPTNNKFDSTSHQKSVCYRRILTARKKVDKLILQINYHTAKG